MDIYGNPIVIRSASFKSWMKANHTKQQLKEMCIYGVKSGYYGLIDRRDLNKHYARFKDEIYSYVSNSEMSLSEFAQMTDPWDMDALEEALTWHAAEAIARELTGDMKIFRQAIDK